MTHLYIELNTGLTEEVNSSIISKLYELAISGDLDNTSDLKGRLHSEYAYRIQAEYLNATYPDLYISIDNYTIPFEDPNMITYLNSIGVGSNGMVTEAQAAVATVVANSENTTITKFNELKYFTSITTSRGGITGNSSGICRFYNWTALEEIDISNFTSIGHNSGSALEDTLTSCTSLKKVTASNKLIGIGHRAFGGCPNLEEITGLEGNITLYGLAAFSEDQKLKLSNFDNVTFSLQQNNGEVRGCFKNCKLITSLCFSETTTYLGHNMFEGCSALTLITGLNNITIIRSLVFLLCSNLYNIDLDWSKVTFIGNNAFRGCSSLPIENISIPNLTTLESAAFRGCTYIKTVSNLGLIETISDSTFLGCTQLTSVSYPSTLKTLWVLAFEDCDMLTIIGPEGLEKMILGQYNNKDRNFKYVEVPSTVTDMGRFFHNSFNKQSSDNPVICVIKAINPPTLGYYVLGAGNTTYDPDTPYAARDAQNNSAKKFLGIYVPDASVNDYLAAPGAWTESGIQAKLKPISQLETDSPTYWAVYQQGLSNQ